MSVICDAIRERRMLSLVMDGPRIVCPHRHGWTRSGKEVLSCYQVSGYSRRGGLPSWRLLDLSQCSDMVVLDDTFPASAPGYRATDKKVPRVHCEV